jgi:ornithine--oxo-acid transaminase
LSERSAELGKYLFEQLRSLRSPVIKEVRGRGLWIGVELNVKARPYWEELKNVGVLCKDTHDRLSALLRLSSLPGKKLIGL